MTQIIWWQLKTRLKIRWWVFNFIKSARIFPFRVTVHLLFSFLLQKTLKSVFLPRYKSLKLNHDTNYLMTTEDTVEDPLMSVQFYIKEGFFHFGRVFFISCYSPSTVFLFIAKDALICISTTLWIFKTKPWHKLFDDIWRHGWRSVDECSILYKEEGFFFHFGRVFFISYYSPSTLFLFNAIDALICISTTLWIFKTKPWHKLFDDIWRHGWRSVKECSIFINSKSFHFVLQSIYCFHFHCKRRLNCISTTLWIFKTQPWSK